MLTCKKELKIAKSELLLHFQSSIDSLDVIETFYSFKERGARYALLKLSAEDRHNGVISASLGNHAQGLSYHAFKLGIPCTVVMPITAPIMKIQKCKNFNAEVLVEVCTMILMVRICNIS